MIQKLAVSLRLKIGIGEIVMANNACRKLPVGVSVSAFIPCIIQKKAVTAD